MTVHQLFRRRLLQLAILFTALGLLALSCINCASSTLGKSLNVGVAVAGAADLHSTNYGLARGGVEMNPLGQQEWQRTVMKAAGIGAVFAGTAWLEKEHQTLAHVLRVVTIAAWSSFAAINYRGGIR